jgi:hypothetical protein
MDLNDAHHASPHVGCTPHTCQQYRSTNAFTFDLVGPHTVGSIHQDGTILYYCFCDDILAITPGQPIRIIPRR